MVDTRRPDTLGGHVPPRVIALPAGLDLLRRLRDRHGALMLHQSGGCCDGSAPMCYPVGEFMTGDSDVLLATLPAGSATPVEFWMSASQYEYWKHTHLTVDVVPGPALPVWTGPSDVVVVATRTGAGAYAVAPAYEAARRGVSLLGIGAEDAPLAAACSIARAPYVSLPASRVRHTTLWSLLTPMLLLASDLGLLPGDVADPETTAAALDATAQECGPAAPTFTNPAKTLALELLDSLPVIAAEGPLAAAAAGLLATSSASAAATRSASRFRAANLSPSSKRPLASAAWCCSASGAAVSRRGRSRAESPECLTARAVTERDRLATWQGWRWARRRGCMGA